MIDDWQEVLYWVTIASITIANIFAIRQQNLKRLMHSPVSHKPDISCWASSEARHRE